ncbi:hypothetical protein [Nonomuraea sp. NPDC049141]|uniref:hypothetical protein n=1 Tax=Nonomuraea sp. NPDC049141 TaxID=3155500 RepID=UPI0033FA38D7
MRFLTGRVVGSGCVCTGTRTVTVGWASGVGLRAFRFFEGVGVGVGLGVGDAFLGEQGVLALTDLGPKELRAHFLDLLS